VIRFILLVKKQPTEIITGRNRSPQPQGSMVGIASYRRREMNRPGGELAASNSMVLNRYDKTLLVGNKCL